MKKKRSYIVIPKWQEIRSRIINRDKLRCVDCSLGYADHLAKHGRALTVNHIDGDTDNNTDDNLETLCLECHGRKDGLRTHRSIVEDDKQDIINKYLGKKYSLRTMATLYGCSYETMHRSMKRWGISIRTRSEQNKIEYYLRAEQRARAGLEKKV